MPEITHQPDENGNMVQIVPSWKLRQMLDEEKESINRPDWFRENDEWDAD